MIAVVGCGAVSEFFHLPAVERLVDHRDVWLVDPDVERARRLAQRYGSTRQVVANHTQLPHVEAAIVAVPNDLHERVAVDLLKRGTRVLVEKPLARTAVESRRILDAAPDEDSVGVALFRRRLTATTDVARQLATAGRPRTFLVEEGTNYAWSAVSGYVLDRARAGGGVTIDLGPHVLDQLRSWLGELEIVAYRDDAHGGVESDAVVELRAGGATGTIELSRTRELGSRVTIECEGGTIEAPAQDDYAAALEQQLRAFLDGRPAATGRDGLRLAELVDECYARRQPLPEPWTTETLR
jgi:predicted dehydrogenase